MARLAAGRDMTVRGTLGLLGVCGLLVLYLLAVDGPFIRRPPPHPPLLTVPDSAVITVEIVWPDARLRVVRRGGVWHADGSTILPAGLIEDLLATLEAIRPTDALTPSESDAGDYGLGSAGTALILSGADGPVLELQIGDRNPAWTGMYVRRVGSAEVLVVGALLHWELQKIRAAAFH